MKFCPKDMKIGVWVNFRKWNSYLLPPGRNFNVLLTKSSIPIIYLSSKFIFAWVPMASRSLNVCNYNLFLKEAGKSEYFSYI